MAITIFVRRIPNYGLVTDAFFKRWLFRSMNNVAFTSLGSIVAQCTYFRLFIEHKVATVLNMLTCPLTSA